MKNFKILVVGILLSIIGFCSFSNAEKITVQYVGDGNFFPGYCFLRENGIWDNIVAYKDGVSQGVVGSSSDRSYQTMYCFDYTGVLLTTSRGNVGDTYGENLARYIIPSSCPACEECQECPTVDTGAILSGYISISDITDNYCISNGLCGEVSTGLSTLYINDIWHESKPFIYVNIPEEFEWDYTGGVYDFVLDVKGYNTDSDYINSVISSQISKPTSEDLGNLINVVAKFVPGLVIILFIYFIFRFIKKIF